MNRELPPDERDAEALIARARLGQTRASPAMRHRVRSSVAEAIAAGATVRGAGTQADTLQRSLSRIGRPQWTGLALGTVALLGGLAYLAPNAVSRSPVDKVATAGSTALTSTMAELASPDAGTSRLQTVVDGSEESSLGVGDLRNSSNLAAESALLRRADEALRMHKPAEALVPLAAHARRFEQGQLRVEREGLALVAACALGRATRADAERYVAQSPGSVVAARALAVCKEQEAP